MQKNRYNYENLRKGFKMRRGYIYTVMLLLIMSFTFSGCVYKPYNKRSSYQNNKMRKRDKVFLQYAKMGLNKEFNRLKGIRYCYGGKTRRCFDCSGFVSYTYKNVFNWNLPRGSREMSKRGNWVSKSNLEIGDLVFFAPRGYVNHVGIYMGSGKFMHTSSSRGVVISKLNSRYWKRRYYSARRILN